MTAINRREFTQQAIGSLLTYSLLEMLFRADAFADEIKPDTIKWLARVNELAQDVKGQKLKQTEWQKQIEALFE